MMPALCWSPSNTMSFRASANRFSRRSISCQVSAGAMGPNVDYVTATLRRLHDMGIRDRALERLVEALRARERLG